MIESQLRMPITKEKGGGGEEQGEGGGGRKRGGGGGGRFTSHSSLVVKFCLIMLFSELSLDRHRPLCLYKQVIYSQGLTNVVQL